jgi:SAM-dependent methyltransferase
MSEEALDVQRHVWAAGDYSVVAPYLLPISVETVEAAGVGPGARVLDVGVGTGNAALEAARRGAIVTGIDLTPEQIERARKRCADEGFDVDLRVGNAESLDVADGSFDVVLSVMAMIFAPDHARALAEMARACRPGGTVALTAWAANGWNRRWREFGARLLPAPPPGSPRPDEWGDEARVVERFGAAGLRVAVEQRPFAFRFASEREALDTFVGAAGPFIRMMEVAATLGRGDEALEELRGTVAGSNVARDGTCVLPAPYVLAVARR